VDALLTVDGAKAEAEVAMAARTAAVVFMIIEKWKRWRNWV